MLIDTLELENFRCFKKEAFNFDKNLNIICGENGAGKTSILEAIFFLSTLRSHRTSRERELIRIGCSLASVNALCLSFYGSFSMKALLYREKKRSLELNGASIPSSKEWLGSLNSVFFSPADIELLRGGPLNRRRFMNMALCQTFPKYMSVLSQYNKTLENKTKLLKLVNEKNSFAEVLDDFNTRLSALSAEIVPYRRLFITFVCEKAALHHENISGKKEKLDIFYKSQFVSADDFTQILSKKKAAEIASRQCLYGIHRDDFESTINGLDVKNFASQGQVRTAAISIKLAERDFFLDKIGDIPILLLDDVLSELDSERQVYILEKIKDGQVFITGTGDSRLKKQKNGKTMFIRKKEND